MLKLEPIRKTSPHSTSGKCIALERKPALPVIGIKYWVQAIAKSQRIGKGVPAACWCRLPRGARRGTLLGDQGDKGTT
jgi:hypothetical protein